MQMNAPLNCANSAVALTFDTGEHGESVVIVTGIDYDAVHATALDWKNALPAEQCPEVGEVMRHVDNGCWYAVVRTRRETE
jgi:hypothetical protein